MCLAEARGGEAMRTLMAVALGLAVLTARADDTDPKKEPASYLKVEAKGKLRTGLMAIGGETTGVTITTDAGTFEVELPAKADGEKLNGKTVVIAGSMYQ